MRKVRMYMDIPPGLDFDSWHFDATSTPLNKCEGWTRLAFDVEVPEPDVDVEVQAGPAEIVVVDVDEL